MSDRMSKTFRSCQNYVKLVFQVVDHSKKVVHPRLSKIKHDEAMFLRCFFLFWIIQPVWECYVYLQYIPCFGGWTSSCNTFYNVHHGTSFWSIAVAVKRWNAQAERTTVSELSDRQGEPSDRGVVCDSKPKQCAVTVGVIAEWGIHWIGLRSILRHFTGKPNIWWLKLWFPVPQTNPLTDSTQTWKHRI